MISNKHKSDKDQMEKRYQIVERYFFFNAHIFFQSKLERNILFINMFNKIN